MKVWAFIYTLSADASAVTRNEIGDDGCRLIAVGVPSAADAPGQVDALIADGAELIECCGAFGPAETVAVQAAGAGGNGHVSLQRGGWATSAVRLTRLERFPGQLPTLQNATPGRGR